MFCDSCGEEVPDDSIFCPECGARQNLSRASVGTSNKSLSGGTVTTTGSGVITPQAFSNNQINSNTSISSDLMSQIASKVRPNERNLTGIPPISQTPVPSGPTIVPITQEMGESKTSSPTDELVERIMMAEKEIKEEQRNKWLQMNETASDVLSKVNSDLPSHLRPTDKKTSAASSFLKQTIGEEESESGIPEMSLLRRMTEVAIRRVARKRGVAVESPQSKIFDDVAQVNITFIDDGRVLDTPIDLANAFKRQIDTELALKGFEMSSNIVLFKSRDGSINKVFGEPLDKKDDEEESFACEACGELVKASDNVCEKCGAIFEDDDEFDEIEESPRRSPGGPPGRGSGGPPSRGPPGRGPRGPPSRGPGGPPGRGPGGPPSRGPGGPPSRGPGGPPSRGPGGPPRRGPGGPPSRGPGGPSRRGPGGPSRESSSVQSRDNEGPSGRGPGGPPTRGPRGPPRSAPKGPKRR